MKRLRRAGAAVIGVPLVLGFGIGRWIGEWTDVERVLYPALGLLAAGCALVYPPAGLIVPGAVLCYAALRRPARGEG